MTTTADHLRNALDGRWRDVKNGVREELSNEIFRPHYTPNTVIARTKVAEIADWSRDNVQPGGQRLFHHAQINLFQLKQKRVITQSFIVLGRRR